MSEVAADLSALAGFRLDLHDMGTVFGTNSGRLLPGLTLPTGTSGLLGDLSPVLESFQSALSAASLSDRSALETYANELSTTATQYRSTDGSTSQSLVTTIQSVTGTTGTAGVGPTEPVTRFSGLNLPNLTEEQEPAYTLARTVTGMIEVVRPYDDALSAAIGIKPAADFLAPLVGDWEALAGIGKRIRLLGINDFVTAQNLANGTTSLRQTWSGDAAQAFSTQTTQRSQAIDRRSVDLDIVAKIVENGGRALERWVHNQTYGLGAAVVQPMTLLGMTLPFGVWARLIHGTMRTSIRNEIAAAADDFKRTAESRRNAITALTGHITRALSYRAGDTAPTYNASDFDMPDKVVVDLGTHRYGYAGKTWWEDSIAPAT